MVVLHIIETCLSILVAAYGVIIWNQLMNRVIIMFMSHIITYVGSSWWLGMLSGVEGGDSSTSLCVASHLRRELAALDRSTLPFAGAWHTQSEEVYKSCILYMGKNQCVGNYIIGIGLVWGNIVVKGCFCNNIRYSVHCKCGMRGWGGGHNCYHQSTVHGLTITSNCNSKINKYVI